MSHILASLTPEQIALMGGGTAAVVAVAVVAVAIAVPHRLSARTEKTWTSC